MATQTCSNSEEQVLTIDRLRAAYDLIDSLPKGFPCMREIASDSLIIEKSIQTFIPRSKKRRIVDKCRKRFTVHLSEPDPNLYVFDNPVARERIVYGHPLTLSLMNSVAKVITLGSESCSVKYF